MTAKNCKKKYKYKSINIIKIIKCSMYKNFTHTDTLNINMYVYVLKSF